MEHDDIARLTAALRTVGVELDALSHRGSTPWPSPHAATQPPASPAPAPAPVPQAQRYREALRDAVQALERTRTSFKSKELGDLRRSLETLLFEGAAMTTIECSDFGAQPLLHSWLNRLVALARPTAGGSDNRPEAIPPAKRASTPSSGTPRSWPSPAGSRPGWTTTSTTR